MLQHLSIKNYVLIKELSLSPSRGFNIITGETGAGKSIILGAIGLLLGKRAELNQLYDPNEKCVIEGEFDIREYDLKSLFEEEELDYEETCIIRREIAKTGKSRGFINDTPVRLETMRKIGSRLLDIHSQHQTLLLHDQEFQTEILDLFGDNGKLLEGYQENFQKYRKSVSAYQRLQKEASEAKKELDYHSFLLNELVEASLEPDEKEKMEEEAELMENAETIKASLHQVLEGINGEEHSANNLLQRISGHLRHIAGFSKNLEQLHERLESCLIELQDIGNELEREESNVEFDPERNQTLQERLSLIYGLEQKHGVQNVEALLKIQDDLQGKVDAVTNVDDQLEALKAEADKALTSTQKLGNDLSAARKKIAPKLEAKLKELLKDLGMPEAQILIDQKTCAPSPTGLDEITFLFSANKGIAPASLKQAGSGGEFSRLMFSLKYLLAQKTALPTVIFDEIDTGISGEISMKMGAMMERMAQGHQIFTITHQPQIAGKGEAHFFVYKDNSSEKTVSDIRRLNEKERREAIAQMIGGEKPGESAYKSAEELLKN